MPIRFNENSKGIESNILTRRESVPSSLWIKGLLSIRVGITKNIINKDENKKIKFFSYWKLRGTLEYNIRFKAKNNIKLSSPPKLESKRTILTKKLETRITKPM